MNLGQSALNSSRLVYGCMRIAGDGSPGDRDKGKHAVRAAVDAGYTLFDHADIYGHYTTEEAWGKAFEKSSIARDQVQIITKCGIQLLTPNRPHHKFHAYNTTADHILKSVENSLRYLKTDYIDILLIHRPDPLMNGEEVARALHYLRKSGKVRYFGVSNFHPRQIDLLQGFLNDNLIVNQLEVNLVHHGLVDSTVTYNQKASPEHHDASRTRT